MKKDIDYERLSDFPLFNGIRTDELKILLPCLNARESRYKKNHFIVIDTENMPFVGMILDGSVHILKEDLFGERTFIASIGRGELFGASFMLTNGTSLVSLQAVSNVKVLCIPVEKILYTCSSACPFHKRIVHNIFSLLAGKNVQLMQKIEILSKTTLRQKILCYLSQLSVSQKSKDVVVPLNRTEMAAYLNSNRSAMSRELKAMQEDGLISVEGNLFRSTGRNQTNVQL